MGVLKGNCGEIEHQYNLGMKIEIELSDKQIKAITEDCENYLGYKVVDVEKLVKQVHSDLFSGPWSEQMGYDCSGLGDSDEPEDLEEWGVELIEAEDAEE